MTKSRFAACARTTLAIPLFWKILTANMVVIVAAALLGWALGHELALAPRPTIGIMAAFTFAGTSLSLLVNAVILHLALEPLDRLQRVAARVQEGDLRARVPDSPLADPALRRLAQTLNGALDALAASRRSVRLLLTRSMEADEAERRRIANALEEDAAQRLASLLMELTLCERDPDRRSLSEIVERAGREITRVIEIVRGYAGQRRPAVLDDLGVVAALEADARRIMESEDLWVRLEGVEPTGLPPETQLSLYRIVREALDNAACHAGARSIRVRISNGDSAVVAIVEDDGRGFEPESAQQGLGLGLAAMRERAESAGGRMSIWSAPGRGSRVRVEIPCALHTDRKAARSNVKAACAMSKGE